MQQVNEAPEPSSKELSTPNEFFNAQDPRALINLVAPAVQDAMLRSFQEKPDYLGMDERTLWKALRASGEQPTPTDNRLRIAFWNEYDRAQAAQKAMDMTAIYQGVCSKAFFYTKYLKRPEQVAWLLCPPASYDVRLEEALAFGLEQMRDILELPLELPNGKIDTKLAELKAKIVAMFDLRMKGAHTQKVINENRNMNLNISATNKDVANRLAQGTMEDLQKRLKELEGRDRLKIPYGRERAENPSTDGEIIDVEATPSPEETFGS